MSRYFYLSLLLICLSACQTTNVYTNPLTELSASVTRTKVAIGSISDEVYNSTATNRALAAAADSKRFGTNDLDATIAPEYLQVRVRGLELIDELAKRLLSVVDSKAGSEAATALQTVGDKAQVLAKQIDSTSSVANYAGPVSKLAATVITIYDQHKRQEILEKGVKDGVPQAKKIVELLKKDFTPKAPTNIQDTLRDELQQTVTEKIAAYDNMLKLQRRLSDDAKKNPDLTNKRFKAIEQIIAAQTALNALNSQIVADTLDDLDRTLDNLKGVVENNNDPHSLAIFAAELSNFSKSSVALLEAANGVKRARQGSTQ